MPSRLIPVLVAALAAAAPPAASAARADQAPSYDQLVHCAATSQFLAYLQGLDDGAAANSPDIVRLQQQSAALMAVAAVATGADADTVLADVAADFPVIDALVRDPAGRDRFLSDTVPGCNTLGAAAMRAVDGADAPAALPAIA